MISLHHLSFPALQLFYPNFAAAMTLILSHCPAWYAGLIGIPIII